MGATLNIGLCIGRTKNVYPGGLALYPLREIGVKLQRIKTVHKPKQEPALVIQVDRPLTQEEAVYVCNRLEQEAIAQLRDDGLGELLGPGAKEWGEFDRKQFTTFEEIP